jgi:16S rRNA (cytidine1402-2'-O)-methyltransferase
LIDCLEILGNRKAAVVREITKLHEEIVPGNLAELSEKFLNGEIKGEIVLVIDRAEIENRNFQISKEKSLPERVVELENKGIDRKLALKKAAKEFGLSRSEAYRILQTQKERQ